MEFSAQPNVTITSISSMIGIALGVAIIWGIWQDKAWTPKLLLGAAAGYTVWYWTERLIWQQPRPNWLFAVIVNLALVCFVLFCLKSLTREAYERESQYQKTE